MNNYIIELKKKYTEDLGRSAQEFLDIGIKLFYRYINSESASSQAALNTMATGLELMLKAFLAEKNLGLIFKNLPVEMRAFLSCPETVPDFFEWLKFKPDIRSDKLETFDLDDCITCFYIFFPHIKQLLMPHIKYLTRWGSVSEHNVLPSVELYEFERTGYAVFHIVSQLSEDEFSRLIYYSLAERDRKFIKSFEATRVERVKLAIEQAKNEAIETDDRSTEVIVAHDWETYVTRCPVCNYNGNMEGYTEIAVGEDEEGPQSSLDFFATTFSCNICSLKLYDIEEIKLANMAILYDRSEDLDRWFHEHRDFADWFME